ncbi:MAG: cofactor-independent phosphoglycerate mutase [Firmicutes bacterium HGW-Firmicutes-11]|nr:MAG: cofactor-independent phosphoglycerate mutase [Firmicutes bacterium HGW-Firmicutes-11]
MKYLIILTDGAADEPLEALGNRTPLEAAKLPNIDSLASRGTVGMVRTIPPGMSPGSDTANLSVMGFDPATYHTGRSPLEAVSMGIEMDQSDVAFRCNLVTLEGDGDYADRIIIDHSAGDITTDEAKYLILSIQNALGTDAIRFYPGVSYRHAMIVHNGDTGYDLTPPHDILDQRIGEHLPKGERAFFLEEMMRKSVSILETHPVNLSRERRGLRPANSIWVWGEGRKPALPSFYEKYGIHGATISAVDLIKGIGVCAGLEALSVPGATGTIHTNFDGKATAAVEAFQRGVDFVYLHLEAPDECSHQGDLEGKLLSLELIDEKVVGPIVRYLAGSGESYRIMVLPDHPTPMRTRTHSREPVPFVLYDSGDLKEEDPKRTFCEFAAVRGMFFPGGHELADYFFKAQR